MSQMKDKFPETPNNHRVSLKSNGSIKSVEKMSTDEDGVKVGMLQTLRKSFRRAAEKSPLSSGVKGLKVTSKSDTAGNESDSVASPPPKSPSLSADSPTDSLRNIEKKEDDTNMSKFGSLMKRGASLRQSLKMVTKKDSDKTSNKDVLVAVSQGSVEDKKEEQEVLREEIEEDYILPDIPLTPLSVMEINKLIEMEMLEDAHLNLLALRQEFQQQWEQCPEDSTMELAKKEKDLNLLYKDLRKKISEIVRDSNSVLLLPVARIIQEEEKRAGEPGALPDSWMEAWRESVCAGVQVKVKSIHLDGREQNSSWLAVHLGLLGKAIVEDLENVKLELRWSYPPSFKVFSTYVRGYNTVVAQHLKKLEQQVTELKDLYVLLDWIINKYKSERVMGSLSLQPDMQDENTDLQLEKDFLEQLKEKYCCRMKEKLRSILGSVIQLENEEVWRDGKAPRMEDNFPISSFPIDISTNVKSFVSNSLKIDAQLEVKVVSSCLEELKQFPNRFQTEFGHFCSTHQRQPVWTEYQITYINSFASLQKFMEEYKKTCAGGVKGFEAEAEQLIHWLMRGLEDQFKEDVKPYLRRMMTRKWLTNNDDFDHLYKRTEQLSQHCGLMMPPHAKEFASKLHCHVAIEYIGQLMKSNYSCKNRKHEKAATKIRQQWNKLRDLFEDMKSTNEWLNPVGDDLSNIIGQKNKTDIKNHLQPLINHYPDFSKKHLVAVLYFRGLMRGHEHQLILQRLTILKKEMNTSSSDRNRDLFSKMQVTVNSNCLSNLPFSCFSFMMPDN
ncbi:exocyst complex component 3-like protein 4 [Archocentrus centrarchus]|uniref:exocyst complex component 3-like protein 4 n=1 Tax=Archocentrus centrarchus TaxID=63155 RepID=UPI0011EA3924|nr:exocyst complex component 3-like protein 4 [Archocentrus centrarchus]